MKGIATPSETARFKAVSREKAGGATYTPKPLSNFVAAEIVKVAKAGNLSEPLKILDPAVGNGELLVSLLDQLRSNSINKVEAYGFETDEAALNISESRLKSFLSTDAIHLERNDFLNFAFEQAGAGGNAGLFCPQHPSYDVVIANPPYVRTQILGAQQSRVLAHRFGLKGRVDLYHAFVIGISAVLKPGGVAGIIVSNRFMTTKSGAALRAAIREQFKILHVWDLGDTKLFDVAVLPAVLLLEGRSDSRDDQGDQRFTSIYQTDATAAMSALDPVCALQGEGVVEVRDGRRFRVVHGALDLSGHGESIWRMATEARDTWLATARRHTWGTFGEIGPVRVGVKTCADDIFIRLDWRVGSPDELPELLRPLTTHHVARRFKSLEPSREILYPHEVVNGRRQAVDLGRYPNARAYLEKHRTALERRGYVIDAGRSWYEIWVPQDPAAWARPKLVFRDISEQPTFWIDEGGAVVNGDCYWLTCSDAKRVKLLWLAVAVGNSSFIECFYDHNFNNKLYAGRRRFISQYVEKFPLPDPEAPSGGRIIEKARRIYDCIGTREADLLAAELDEEVWRAFGLDREEIVR